MHEVSTFVKKFIENNFIHLSCLAHFTAIVQ